MSRPKLPPYDQEAEDLALGCMMLNKQALDRGLEQLTAGDFYVETRKMVFETITSLYSRNVEVDASTVIVELQKQKRLEPIGGTEVILRMPTIVTTPAHIDFYIEQIKNYSMLRSLLAMTSEVAKDCYECTDDPQAVVDKAEKLVYAISDDRKSKTELLNDVLFEAMDRLDGLVKGKQEFTGTPTGFKKFDLMTSGLQPGNMVILAARPSMGKTSLALDIVRNVILKAKKPVIFFSLEQSKVEIGNRLLSAQSRLPLWKIQTGKIFGLEMTKLTEAHEKYSECKLYIDCTSAVTPIGLRSTCRRIAGKLNSEKNPLGLIVIDYLQLLSGSNKRHDNRQSEVSEISRSLKALAMDLNVPIMALSQLNRQTEETTRAGRPRLSDLRESGSIEQDADLVAFIYREAMYRTGATDDEKALAKLQIAKHRNGPLGEVDLYFQRECSSFVELEKEESVV